MKLGNSEVRRILYIALGALLCLLVLAFGLTSTGLVRIPFLDRIISTVFVPVQRAITSAYQDMTSSIDRRQTIQELNQQIAMLTETNKQLEASLAQMNELSRENQRLSELLGVTQTMQEYDFAAAQVVGVEPGGWFSTFTIGLGSKDGVSKDDPVLNADGLVGRVIEVNARSAQVLSVVDARSAVAGLVERTRDNGVVRGSLFLTERDELAQMHYLPAGSELKTGDRVITSGLDGVYPKGLYLGQVRSISRDENEEERYVVIDTAVDFRHLEDVLVMRLGGSGTPEEEE